MSLLYDSTASAFTTLQQHITHTRIQQNLVDLILHVLPQRLHRAVDRMHAEAPDAAMLGAEVGIEKTFAEHRQHLADHDLLRRARQRVAAVATPLTGDEPADPQYA